MPQVCCGYKEDEVGRKVGSLLPQVPKTITMLILLYGADTYRSRQKLKEIVESHQKIHRSGINIRYFEGKNLSFPDFRSSFGTLSMFAEKKLFILRNVFEDSSFKEAFLQKAREFAVSPNTVLFYEEKEIAAKDPLLGFLKKESKFQEFQPLEGQKLNNWVKREFAAYKARVSKEAVDKITEFCGNDLWQLSGEVKKLALYSQGNLISERDVEQLARPRAEAEIFKTIEAIAARDKKRALDSIYRHLEKGDTPLYLISMINFQLRNLLMVKDLLEQGKNYRDLAGSAKLHPYVIQKTCVAAKRFTFSELKKIYQKLFEADVKIKRGQIDPREALDLFIADL